MELISYVPKEYATLFCVIPAVFVYLWTLIFGDLRNFSESQKAYSEFTAKDPVNCYQNFPIRQNGKEHEN